MSQGPNDVVFKDSHGRVLTQRDLANLSGSVNWEIRSKAVVPTDAKKLHELGREAGQQGDTKKAIALFSESSKAAPEWPYPVYDLAFTYLLAGDSAKALSLYEQVADMTPRGFFTTFTAVHTLKREQEGKLPKGTYKTYLSLEWVSDPSQKAKIIAHLTNQVHGFAPGWKARTLEEENHEKRLQLVNRGLDSNPDAETKGFLLLNKAVILNALGKKTDAVSILGKLALDPSSPCDVELLAKKTLASILSK